MMTDRDLESSPAVFFYSVSPIDDQIRRDPVRPFADGIREPRTARDSTHSAEVVAAVPRGCRIVHSGASHAKSIWTDVVIYQKKLGVLKIGPGTARIKLTTCKFDIEETTRIARCFSWSLLTWPER